MGAVKGRKEIFSLLCHGIIKDNMREPRPYGKHQLYIEGDILFSIPKGEITLAEAQTFNAVVAEVIAKYGYCMLLADLKDSKGIDADARRYSAKWGVGKPILGIAMVNEKLVFHALFTLLLKAMNMLRQQPVPFTVFKTEDEARGWLAQLRKQHLAKAQQAPESTNSSGTTS